MRNVTAVCTAEAAETAEKSKKISADSAFSAVNFPNNTEQGDYSWPKTERSQWRIRIHPTVKISGVVTRDVPAYRLVYGNPARLRGLVCPCSARVEEGYRHIGYFLDDVYMTRRVHSALGYMPPAEFEALYTAQRIGIGLSELTDPSR